MAKMIPYNSKYLGKSGLVQPHDTFTPINVIFYPCFIKQRSLDLQKKDYAENYCYRIHHA